VTTLAPAYVEIFGVAVVEAKRVPEVKPMQLWGSMTPLMPVA